jgi:hypothetical protein
VYGQGGVLARFDLVRGRDEGKSVDELRLVGGDYAACPKRKRSGQTTVIRQLWGSGQGRFRTRGRYAAATVRGAVWLTADRCDGTLVQVRRGTVAVFSRRRQVIVPAGTSFLARP